MIGFIGDQDLVSIEALQKLISLPDIIKLPQLSTLYDAICSHADVLCCSVGNKIVLEPTIYDQLVDDKSHRNEIQLNHVIIKGQTHLEGKYPYNIAYNVAFIGTYAIHNTHYTDPVVKDLVDEEGYQWIHTKQGYTNCTYLTVGPDAAITSDAGLAKTLRLYNIKVLEIEPGHIKLPGMNYGFIGGAAIGIGDVIYFFGDIRNHPDGERIIEFLGSQGISFECLNGGPLIDIGSMRLVK